MKTQLGWVLALSIVGCESDAAEPSTNSAAAPTQENAPLQPTAEAPEAAQAPSVPAVELLDTVAAALGVSSVYRDRIQQVPHLTDGDLETTWNSRSGDLEGAWIEVRLPAEVEVSSIEMTVGFTKTGDSDLFTGNHRIERVRVLHDGEAVGEFPLDIESRALQTLAVEGSGGVYRIEVLSTVAGSRDDWREVCITELRFMGQPAGAGVGSGTPSFAVGALPPLPSEPIALSTASDTLADDVEDIALSWGQFDEQLRQADFTTGDPGVSAEERASLVEVRGALFERVARLIEPADSGRAAELRRYAAADGSWSWASRRTDLDQMASALDAMVAGSADEALRCRWILNHISLRLSRMAALGTWELELAEVASADAYEGDDDAEVRRADRRVDILEARYERLESIHTGWFEDDAEAATARRMVAMDRPASPLLAPEWDAILVQLGPAREHCGW